MRLRKKTRVFILDTSAILSGKPIYLDDSIMVTIPNVIKEIKPGGRGYRTLRYLLETGLAIYSPSEESLDRVKTVSLETGDKDRLSSVDKGILALALDINKKEKEAIILTDDYSIQNVAHVLNIKFENISQRGITKKFKWAYQCRGCGKKFEENIKVCPICGSLTKNIIADKENI